MAALLLVMSSAPLLPAQTAPATQPVGERVPSDDATIKDLHQIGLVNGQTDIFRSACPVRDLARRMTTTRPSADLLAAAEERMRHLHDLGIRTVISFQDPSGIGDDGKPDESAAAVVLERKASQAAGIHFISRPIKNAGPGSLETLTDQQVIDLLQPLSEEIFQYAKTGGVLYHCSAGHDRTGIMTAYIRLKYQQWPVGQAIDEMRRYGHNWPKFSHDGGESSWHEEHLKAIARMLAK